MNPQQIYHKATHPLTEQELKDKEYKESEEILLRMREKNEIDSWLDLVRTKTFLSSLDTIANKLSNQIIDLAYSNELFNLQGRNIAIEVQILRKVTNYARTGKYSE